MLEAFSRRHGITFDLLSDEGSQVIERLGLLNRHVPEQQAFYGKAVAQRHQGIPYPGTLVLDEEGVVRAKHFEQSYRDRPSGSALVHEIGGAPSTAGAVREWAGPAVAIRVATDSPTYRPLQQFPVHVRVDLAPGVHAYTEPVPDGYVPLGVSIPERDGVQSWPVEMPSGRPFTVAGLDERFFVVEGAVDLTVPVKLSGPKHDLLGRERAEPLESGTATVPVVVRFQACTDSECFPPQEIRLDLDLQLEELVD